MFRKKICIVMMGSALLTQISLASALPETYIYMPAPSTSYQAAAPISYANGAVFSYSACSRSGSIGKYTYNCQVPVIAQGGQGRWNLSETQVQVSPGVYAPCTGAPNLLQNTSVLKENCPLAQAFQYNSAYPYAKLVTSEFQKETVTCYVKINPSAAAGDPLYSLVESPLGSIAPICSQFYAGPPVPTSKGQVTLPIGNSGGVVGAGTVKKTINITPAVPPAHAAATYQGLSTGLVAMVDKTSSGNMLFRGNMPLTWAETPTLSDMSSGQKVDFQGLFETFSKRYQAQTGAAMPSLSGYTFIDVSLIGNDYSTQGCQGSHCGEGAALYREYLSFYNDETYPTCLTASDPYCSLTSGTGTPTFPLSPNKIFPAYPIMVNGVAINAELSWQPVLSFATPTYPSLGGAANMSAVLTQYAPQYEVQTSESGQPVVGSFKNLEQVVSYVKGLMDGDSKVIVYIHCMNGDDRTSLVSTAYLLDQYQGSNGITLAKAADYGTTVLSNPFGGVNKATTPLKPAYANAAQYYCGYLQKKTGKSFECGVSPTTTALQSKWAWQSQAF